LNYWIFIVTNHKEHNLEGRQILLTRIGDNFWGLGEKTGNRNALQPGDKVAFYVGDPEMVFAATAALASASFCPSTEERERLSHDEAFYRAEFGVRLKDAIIWEKPKRVAELVENLGFIKNKLRWGPFFQGGIKAINEHDYMVIIGSKSESNVSRSEEDEGSQFALESHLEEFIDSNWDRINFGERLSRYRTEEQSGRQFPAGTWSIDFLCRGETSRDFVIVELKRGKSSDATIGQVLRYIGWVKENLAGPDDDVRAIIIAHDVDDALRYATKQLANVRLLTYSIDFKLLQFKG
jgi:hypothetical protein